MSRKKNDRSAKMNDNPTRRRTFLLSTAAVGTFGIAGCIGEEGEDPTDDADENGDGMGDDDPFDDEEEDMADDGEGEGEGDGDGFVIRVGTASSGSATFAHAQATQAAIENHGNTDIVQYSTQETAGMEANLYIHDEDQVDAVSSFNIQVIEARDGEGGFEEDPVDPDNLPYQGWLANVANLHWIAREDTDIETMDDFEGHRIWPIQPGFGTRAVTEDLLRSAGMWDDLDIVNMGTGDIAGALEEGNVDAMATYGTNAEVLPGWVTEVDTRADMRDVSMNDEFRQAIEDFEGVEYDQYDQFGWEQDLQVRDEDGIEYYEAPVQFFFGPHVPSDAVYEVARVVHEHIDDIRDADPGHYDHSDVENMVSYTLDDYPVHPGAAEFYQDEGIWDDSWEIGEER
ncbi:TAXI family TRAP transporter solute-binding subunit [Natronorarus salvus]|uniref:TAXI family TRAP transporter solute-binding subunit n=1 Tax=Natronorarus salvus TaxID=3117733 RepID=UPI002F26DECF